MHYSEKKESWVDKEEYHIWQSLGYRPRVPARVPRDFCLSLLFSLITFRYAAMAGADPGGGSPLLGDPKTS